MNKFKKYIYVAIGLISFAIGAVGIIVPILPTTPFLLLSSYCFVRGSKKFDDWFKSTNIYKNHLESFVNEKAMTKKQKRIILITVSLMLLIPFILVNNLYMRIFLIGLICFKFYYLIFRVKTIDKSRI